MFVISGQEMSEIDFYIKNKLINAVKWIRNAQKVYFNFT